jgi:hypothetical protein
METEADVSSQQPTDVTGVSIKRPLSFSCMRYSLVSLIFELNPVQEEKSSQVTRDINVCVSIWKSDQTH